ncbi:TPA: GTP-binding protein [Candidatus Woesearchaeota archaeon]|nr:GTP-binding protein [Candidatus Woesearchaeota archaeon]
MATYAEQIADLEAQILKTQYNKATQHHIGLVKAKIAHLREKAETRAKASGGPGDGYQVRKTGDGTVILLGFPSTGKSTVLNTLCGTESEVAAYAFTTLTCIPGMLNYKHAKIQILDVPGIVAGAATGRGRGKEVLAVMRNADMCMFIVDVLRPNEFAVIRREAESVGIRFNTRRPDVKIKRTARGGIKIAKTCRLTMLDDETIVGVLKEFRYNSADVIIREDISVDQLIDCIEDNKKYMPAITVFNKMDLVTTEQMAALEREYRPDIFISAQRKENIEALRQLIYDKLDLMSVYLKEPGKEADMNVPLIMFRTGTIRDLCEKLHKDFVTKFKFSRVWGKSAKFGGQKLMLGHHLKDGDVVEIHVK